MPLIRAVAASFVLLTLAAPPSKAQQPAGLVGDPDRGKVVYRSVGKCESCHGWFGDGRMGVNLRSPPGANLRESGLDGDGLIEVIACGLPGTAMPFHDRAAYDGGRCNGMVLSDFAPDEAPKRGKTMSAQNIANVVAYLQTHVIGRGKPTFEECAAYFETRAASACTNLK